MTCTASKGSQTSANWVVAAVSGRSHRSVDAVRFLVAPKSAGYPRPGGLGGAIIGAMGVWGFSAQPEPYLSPTKLRTEPPVSARDVRTLSEDGTTRATMLTARVALSPSRAACCSGCWTPC